MKYTPFYKPQFGEDVKTYASLKKQIEKKVESIISDPYHNTEPLEKKDGHDLRGLLSRATDIHPLGPRKTNPLGALIQSNSCV